MKLITAFFLLIFFSTPFLFGQNIDIKFVGEEEWEKPSYYSITSTNEILVANTLIDSTNSTGFYQITKLDFDGNILKSYTFGDTPENKAYDVVQSSQGDIFFLGFNGENNTLELYKFDSDLVPIWNMPIGAEDSFKGSFVLYYDKIMVVCTSYSEVYNLMLDFEGSILWEKTISDSMNKYAASNGFKTENGDVITIGFTVPNDSLKSDGFGYKISEAGDIEWETIVPDTFHSDLSSIIEFENGELFGIGTQYDYQNGAYFATLTKFDNIGNVIFQKTIDNDNYLVGNDILIYNDLIFMLCTTSRNVPDIMLVILDIQGNEISRHNLGDNRISSAQQIKLINDNELLIIGYGVNESNPEINVDMKFIKISDLDALSSTNELDLERFVHLFPNPVQRNSTISIEKEIKAGALFNQLGIKVMDIKNSNKFSTDNLPSGIYFLYGFANNNEYLEAKIVVVE